MELMTAFKSVNKLSIYFLLCPLLSCIVMFLNNYDLTTHINDCPPQTTFLNLKFVLLLLILLLKYMSCFQIIAFE